MIRTGVYATEDQLKELQSTRGRPAIILQLPSGKSVQELCHEFALKQGLPDYPGMYGIDLVTGEFVK